MSGNIALFVGQFLRNPDQIRSLVPSSRALGRRACGPLSPKEGLVIELGAGTGTITGCILERGIPRDRLVLIETNPAFCTQLARDFPGVRVENIPAQALDTLPLPEPPAAIVSGVPVLAMPVPVQRAIIGAAFSRLRPGGMFLQLTYGLKPPVAAEVRDEFGLRWERLGRVWLNLPPAEVYCFRRG